MKHFLKTLIIFIIMIAIGLIGVYLVGHSGGTEDTDTSGDVSDVAE